MSKTQYYDIMFPIQVKRGKSLFDLNRTKNEMVKSQLIHLLFTPEGQKLRNPMFGTTLIQFLYNPNDNQTWEDVILHIKEKVTTYIPGCNIVDINAEPIDEDRGLEIKVTYTVMEEDGESHQYELTQII